MLFFRRERDFSFPLFLLPWFMSFRCPPGFFAAAGLVPKAAETLSHKARTLHQSWQEGLLPHPQTAQRTAGGAGEESGRRGSSGPAW